MKTGNIALKFNELTGSFEVIHNGFSWVSDGRRPYIILRKKIGQKYVGTYRDLFSAAKKSFAYSDNKVTARLGSYVAFGKPLDFTLILTAEITGENTVEFSLKAENETGYDIQAVYFPAPFNSKKKGKAYLPLRFAGARVCEENVCGAGSTQYRYAGGIPGCIFCDERR